MGGSGQPEAMLPGDLPLGQSPDLCSNIDCSSKEQLGLFSSNYRGQGFGNQPLVEHLVDIWNLLQ